MAQKRSPDGQSRSRGDTFTKGEGIYLTIRSPEALRNDLAGDIDSMFEERLFNSPNVLCRHFRIGKKTCWRILHDKLGLKKIHFRWISQTLSINQKNERVSYSKLLLTALMEQQASGFQWIINGKDS
jgi:hypothetical protein